MASKSNDKLSGKSEPGSIQQDQDSNSSNDHSKPDPLLHSPHVMTSNVVRRGDWFLLAFPDGKSVFGLAETSKYSGGAIKMLKRSYPTDNLIGLPYGTVVEVERNSLRILPPTASIVPPPPDAEELGNDSGEPSCGETEPQPDATTEEEPSEVVTTADDPKQDKKRDNRHIVDNNTSQALAQNTLLQMKKTSTGSQIVQRLVQNSATFRQKTDFSRAKYIAKKQRKYQPRCRLVQCNANTISQAIFQKKDPKKFSSLRPDTLAQLLAYSNITAGAHVLVWEELHGMITASIAERMAGYGSVFSLYTGQQVNYHEMLQRFNFSFAVQSTIQWVHLGDVLDQDITEKDLEAADRDAMTWPCALQDHTRRYLQSAELCPPKHEARRTEKQEAFLEKRYARFTRKLTRPSPQECASNLKARPCDSLLLVIRQYDIQETLEGLLPYLAPSCPLVIFCEYLEPLTQCFQWLQDNQLAIHLHLMSTWTREYQVLPGRTHPAMNMSQNGGFVLTGIKLDTELGRNQEPDEETLQEIRASLPTRRGKKRAPISEGHQKKKDRKVFKSSGDTRESNGKTATR